MPKCRPATGHRGIAGSTGSRPAVASHCRSSLCRPRTACLTRDAQSRGRAQVTSIVHLVPRLGAASNGVADYARALAAALDSQHRIRSQIIESRSAAALAGPLERCDRLLLHYVNYGYSPRGCPFWLVRGLSGWRRQRPQARLLTVFHELYALNAPWRSSFWLSP